VKEAQEAVHLSINTSCPLQPGAIGLCILSDMAEP